MIKIDEQGQHEEDMTSSAHGNSTDLSKKMVAVELDVDFICLPACIGATTNLSIIRQSDWVQIMRRTSYQSQYFVIFQFTITRPDKSGIFRMSCANLSAYPEEDEVIIAGGMPCYVLDIQE